jgi:TonB family protein
MIAATVQPRRWPGRRWGIVVAFVFVVQLGLIFGLSDRTLVQPRTAASRPALGVTRAPAELLALSDPTLFALPHREGFSGLAWLQSTQSVFRSFDWLAEPRWLPLPVQQLGTALELAVELNHLTDWAGVMRPEPRLTFAAAPPPSTARAESTLRLEGGLAGRRLIVPLELPPEHYTDLLTDTVIQIVVDSEGRPVSVPVLLSSSGSSDADNDALCLARAARFNSVPSGGPGHASGSMAHLTWGRMVFHWLTLPKPVTHTAP